MLTYPIIRRKLLFVGAKLFSKKTDKIQIFAKQFSFYSENLLSGMRLNAGTLMPVQSFLTSDMRKS